MSRYALINEDGLVVNLTEGQSSAPEGHSFLGVDAKVRVGDTFDGQSFIRPAREVQSEARAPKEWTGLEFKRLFTADQRISIRIAAETDSVVEDIIDLIDTAAASGEKITSTDVDVISSIDYLRAKGLIDDSLRNSILGVV